MGKTLVAYFSASGHTRKKAEILAAETGADLYEITPAVPYTKADLNWLSKESRSSVEMRDKKSRPDLVPDTRTFDVYDTIFLGFPIWWYTAPTIVNTFLEAHDFTGKRIIVFATSGSSGFGNTVSDLRPSAPGAEFIEGRVIRKLFAEKDLRELLALAGTR